MIGLYQLRDPDTIRHEATDLAHVPFFSRSHARELMRAAVCVAAAKASHTTASLQHMSAAIDGLSGDTLWIWLLSGSVGGSADVAFVGLIAPSTHNPYDVHCRLRAALAATSESELAEILRAEPDALARVQTTLDETLVLAHRSVALVLNRGEQLEELVEKSGQLSKTTRDFYRQARQTNSCCWVS